jgi:hypothetical protein
LPKHLTQQQTEAIRGYVKKGYSANQIQLSLKKQHIGIRRKVLLGEIRIIKQQPPKPYVIKYIPKKYAKARWRARATHKRLRPTGEKEVTITGKHYGKTVVKTERGSGKDLYHFILNEMTGDYWDERPHIHS